MVTDRAVFVRRRWLDRTAPVTEQLFGRTRSGLRARRTECRGCYSGNFPRGGWLWDRLFLRVTVIGKNFLDRCKSTSGTGRVATTHLANWAVDLAEGRIALFFSLVPPKSAFPILQLSQRRFY